MSDLTWHLEQAKAMLDKWYDMADISLGLISKYKVTHWSLQGKKNRQDGDCRRNALHCKTAGLVWHDRYKMLLDVQRGIFK